MDSIAKCMVEFIITEYIITDQLDKDGKVIDKYAVITTEVKSYQSSTFSTKEMEKKRDDLSAQITELQSQLADIIKILGEMKIG
jgi:bacterioferritin (cytochrome b1)